MEELAAIQFVQDRTIFSSAATFQVSINDQAPIAVPGGQVTNIVLHQVGKFSLKAEIDGYYSPLIQFRIKKGEVLSLLIAPPASRSNRIVGLFGSGKDYLTIIQVGITKLKKVR